MDAAILFLLTASATATLVAGMVAVDRGRPAAWLELLIGALVAAAAVHRAVRMVKKGSRRNSRP